MASREQLELGQRKVNWRMASRYDRLIVEIFSAHHTNVNITSFEFGRDEVEHYSTKLGIKLPKNIGDIIYSFRYRKDLPYMIRDTEPQGMHWVIEGAGRAIYRFVLRPLSKIEPRTDMIAIKIPDATPQIISSYALSDEQALLAKLRYNRLIDVFLGIAACSLQNHLRTTVKGVGQIEIDELYVGLNKHGCQFIIPVQAKGKSDRIGAVQCSQDIAFCTERYPDLICRSLAAQLMAGERIAIFELGISNGAVKVVEERHYELVAEDIIMSEDLADYKMRTYE
jgi:hypothetical protein